MIALVVVSHSRPLAEAARALALQMGGSTPPEVRVAAGLADGGTGTDASAIAQAIDDVASDEGVLVVMDLGSAVLSSEMAQEFVATAHPVRLSAAPFVEGLIAAVALAATGAPLDAVAAEAARALDAKTSQLGDASPGDESPDPASATPATGDRAPDEGPDDEGPDDIVTLTNPSGLHARPAAVLVRLVRSFDASVTLTPVGSDHAPVDAASVIGLMALGATQGTRLRLRANGPDADAARQAVREAFDDGFGEREDDAAGA